MSETQRTRCAVVVRAGLKTWFETLPEADTYLTPYSQMRATATDRSDTPCPRGAAKWHLARAMRHYRIAVREPLANDRQGRQVVIRMVPGYYQRASGVASLGGGASPSEDPSAAVG